MNAYQRSIKALVKKLFAQKLNDGCEYSSSNQMLINEFGFPGKKASEWVNGTLSANPKFETIEDAAKTLGVSVSELFKAGEEEKK